MENNGVRRSERIMSRKNPSEELRSNSMENISSESEDFTQPEMHTMKEMSEMITMLRQQMSELALNLDNERAETKRLKVLLSEKQDIPELPPKTLTCPGSSTIEPPILPNIINVTPTTPKVQSSFCIDPSSPLVLPSPLISSPANMSLPTSSYIQQSSSHLPIPLSRTEVNRQSFYGSPYYQQYESIPTITKDHPEMQSTETVYHTPISVSPYRSVGEINSSFGAKKKIIDLPQFSGEPEEWPGFQIAFNESSSFMRYSNWENHIRLNKALVGIAKESVAALLIHPDNVHKVMEELEQQFGRHEHLLRSQLQKVKKIQQVTEDRLDLLLPFSTTVRNLAAFLETMGSLPHLANPNLIDELVMKLPLSKRVDWGIYSINIKPYVTVRHFSDWLSNLAHVISLLNVTSGFKGTSQLSEPYCKKSSKEVLHANLVKERKCILCEGSHLLQDCSDFEKQEVNERWNIVKKYRLCFSCLKFGHPTSNCRSRKCCRIGDCSKYHNPLLHKEENEVPEKTLNLETSNELQRTFLNCPLVTTENAKFIEPEVLFKIVPVRLYASNKHFDTYAMFDEGSSVTLVDESVLKKMNIKGDKETLTLQWFGKKSSTESSQIVDLEISGIGATDKKYKLNAVHTIKNINLPTQTLLLKNLHTKYHAIKKLPIASYKDVKPLLLIGLDNSFLGSSTEILAESEWTGPVVAKTKLGWVVYGRVNPRSDEEGHENFFLHIRNSVNDEQLNKDVEEYFALENIGAKVPTLESEADKHDMDLLKTTTLKIGNRYRTGLLWKNEDVTLPSSYSMAKQRLISMERKMNKDPIFKSRYIELVNGFIEKKYARKLDKSEANIITKKTWYLPHFATTNVNKPGKYRFVFDAAAKVGGYSINDFLSKGPDFYKSLVTVLFNFRLKSIGVCGDIREMFNQIEIQPEDRQAQRFLWRGGDTSKPIDVYIMDVMTFGMTCSPASAHFVKNYNALQFISLKPKAVKSIIEHHYVDDFVDSFDDIDEANKISSEVKQIHSEAGFELRGFVSNSSEVADFLNECKTENYMKPMNLKSSTEKILGMFWDTSDDCFKFVLKFNKVKMDVINGSRCPTKRELLSVIMSVFDPFGFLCNIMIHAKIMMQQIWRLHVTWDEPIPEEIHKKYLLWRAELLKLEDFRVPRHYFWNTSSTATIQVHTFVDASEDAYAAVTYFRIIDGSQITVVFVSGRTKCSPLKNSLSIPRLELESAVLGSRLCCMVLKNHDIKVSQRFFWTDSAIVIHWIKSSNRRYKPYVAHRISEILEETDPFEWNWISTKNNVADDATRAKYPIRFDPLGRWINGSDFLRLPEDKWELRSPEVNIPADEELRPKHMNLATVSTPWIDLNKFTSLTKYKKVVAWIRRFVNNKFCLGDKISGPLTVNELIKAEQVLCQLAQRECFQKEISSLKQKQNIDKSSHIYKLSPFLDDEGLIRLNGRIRRTDAVPEFTKYPIILPKQHILSNLIVGHYHNKMCHQNEGSIANEIRQKYWIPNIKCLVKKSKTNCQICKNRSAVAQPPRMGDLPYDRVSSYIRPFSYCGLDYFGPLNVTIGRRREKRWVALFTCLSTRAVHLELAENLSTDACLLCIRNFVNRRGVPIKIRSDNGTNFIGSSKELSNLQSELSLLNIKWEFNCPDNPHAGGAWERLVQCTKRVLSYTLHEEAPKVETLRSLLIEAECIVNSRPLTDLPLSHEDDEPLTPNHFLIGSLNSTQTPGEEDGKLWCHRKQWRIAQQLKNRFWKQWIKEYLPTLTRRTKWFTDVEPIKTGDLVLIIDEGLSRNCWKKGLVTEVFTAADGQVRSAKVKTASGIFKRPAVKLAVLDVFTK